jgi:hypothetical protein
VPVSEAMVSIIALFAVFFWGEPLVDICRLRFQQDLLTNGDDGIQARNSGQTCMSYLFRHLTELRMTRGMNF